MLSFNKGCVRRTFLKTVPGSLSLVGQLSFSQALHCMLPESRSTVTRCAPLPRSLVESLKASGDVGC